MCQRFFFFFFIGSFKNEGSGCSKKLWLINTDTDQTGLFKYKKDVGTTDHVSECIASDIAGLIGIPCAKIEIGMFKGREGSISFNIVESKSKSDKGYSRQHRKICDRGEYL